MLKIKLLRDLINVSADGLGRPDAMLNGKLGDVIEVTERIAGFILVEKWGTTYLTGGNEKTDKADTKTDIKDDPNVTITNVGKDGDERGNGIVSEDVDPETPNEKNTGNNPSEDSESGNSENNNDWALEPDAIAFLKGLTKALMEKVGNLYGVRIPRTQTLPVVREQLIDAVRKGTPKKIVGAEFVKLDLVDFYEKHFNIVLDSDDYVDKNVTALTEDMACILEYAFAFDA